MMTPLYWSRMRGPHAIALIFPQLTLKDLLFTIFLSFYDSYNNIVSMGEFCPFAFFLFPFSKKSKICAWWGINISIWMNI